MPLGDPAGKVAVVTGAASGIGRALVDHAAALGEVEVVLDERVLGAVAAAHGDTVALVVKGSARRREGCDGGQLEGEGDCGRRGLQEMKGAILMCVVRDVMMVIKV